MQKDRESALKHYAGAPVSHARVILAPNEAGPVTVRYQNSEGKEVIGYATQYDGYWSHPVEPTSDYTFHARWENTVNECPSCVIFTKEEIIASMPETVYREPSNY